jgi:hypothetical protein
MLDIKFVIWDYMPTVFLYFYFELNIYMYYFGFTIYTDGFSSCIVDEKIVLTLYYNE